MRCTPYRESLRALDKSECDQNATPSAFHPHAQRNAFRRRDVRLQSRSFARWNQSLRRSPNSNRFAEIVGDDFPFPYHRLDVKGGFGQPAAPLFVKPLPTRPVRTRNTSKGGLPDNRKGMSGFVKFLFIVLIRFEKIL